MSRKKKITSSILIIMIIILLLTGTFAWQDFNQHATNMFEATSTVEVRLNDAFTPPTAWNPNDLAVSKKVSVTNQNASNTLAYVRVQFKEFMETYSLTYTPITDSYGKIVLFATYANNDGGKIGEYIKASDTEAANILDNFNYIPYEVLYPVDYTDPELRGKIITYYRTQNEEIKNGIYGKSMNDPNEEPDSDVVKTFGDAEKAPYNTQPHGLQSATNPECAYNIHEWMDCGVVATDSDAIHNYIKWNLGSQTITMAQWKTTGEHLGNFWVLDEDGWAYWANPLAPGATTANIMESVELTKMPGQSFEYYIHIEMGAVTADELTIEFRNDDNTTDDLIDKLININISAYTRNTYASGTFSGEEDGTASIYVLTGNIVGPNNAFGTEEIIIGLDGIPGTADDNEIVNPAGTVLRSNVEISRDTAADDTPYVDIGNGFRLYPGADGKIGTKDDVVQSFGNYLQNDTTAEPLNWRLLDIDDTTKTATIITDVVLDNTPYGTGTAVWNTSTLHTWLNGTFYSTAFSAGQQGKIVTANVPVTAETFIAWDGSGFDELTITAPAVSGDNVWALSGKEVWKYFGVSTVATTTNITKGGTLSDYTNGYALGVTNTAAAATDKETSAGWAGNSGYWLRSPGTDNTKACYVTTNGNIDADQDVAAANLGARPVVKVRLAP